MAKLSKKEEKVLKALAGEDESKYKAFRALIDDDEAVEKILEEAEEKEEKEEQEEAKKEEKEPASEPEEDKENKEQDKNLYDELDKKFEDIGKLIQKLNGKIEEQEEKIKKSGTYGAQKQKSDSQDDDEDQYTVDNIITKLNRGQQ